MVNQIVGPNIINMLLVLFVAFKLAGIITWSWVWVLSPLWISVAAVLLAAFMGGVFNSVNSDRGR
jgi:hypothetical protein